MRRLAHLSFFERRVAHLSFFERWDSTSLSRLGFMDSADAQPGLVFQWEPGEDEKEARRCMSPRLPPLQKTKAQRWATPPPKRHQSVALSSTMIMLKRGRGRPRHTNPPAPQLRCRNYRSTCSFPSCTPTRICWSALTTASASCNSEAGKVLATPMAFIPPAWAL